MQSEEIESQHVIQNHNKENTSRVCISLSMQRNLGDYENCHFSIRYEQDCKPEERLQTTEILEREAQLWLSKRSLRVDEFIRRKMDGKAQNQDNGQGR